VLYKRLKRGTIAWPDTEAEGPVLLRPSYLLLLLAGVDLTVPLLSQIDAERTRLAALVLPKSPVGDGLRYLANQWDALPRFVEDGRRAIDNSRLCPASGISGIVVERDVGIVEESRETGPALEHVAAAFPSSLRGKPTAVATP